MFKNNKKRRKPDGRKWAMIAAVILMTGSCTTLGTAQAKEEAFASRGSLVFEDNRERLEWNTEDLLLLKEKLSSIPGQCFDPACYTHDHNWVYQDINESTHTKHCDECGSVFDSISAHMAAREERCVITHNGREYPGQKSICECGWQRIMETAHTLLCEPVDAVNHTIRCALDGSAYCRGYEPVTEEHYAYYYVPDEDGIRHGKICLDCGYREEEPCSFTLEEAPIQEETEGENAKEDQTVQGEVWRWCVCGNCMKQEAAEENPTPPVIGEPPEAPADGETAPSKTPADEEAEDGADGETAPPETPADEETEQPIFSTVIGNVVKSSKIIGRKER